MAQRLTTLTTIMRPLRVPLGHVGGHLAVGEPPRSRNGRQSLLDLTVPAGMLRRWGRQLPDPAPGPGQAQPTLRSKLTSMTYSRKGRRARLAKRARRRCRLCRQYHYQPKVTGIRGPRRGRTACARNGQGKRAHANRRCQTFANHISLNAGAARGITERPLCSVKAKLQPPAESCALVSRVPPRD